LNCAAQLRHAVSQALAPPSPSTRRSAWSTHADPSAGRSRSSRSRWERASARSGTATGPRVKPRGRGPTARIRSGPRALRSCAISTASSWGTRSPISWAPPTMATPTPSSTASRRTTGRRLRHHRRGADDLRRLRPASAWARGDDRSVPTSPSSVIPCSPPATSTQSSWSPV